MQLYRLMPPYVKETPAGFGRFFWRYGINRGDSLLVYGSRVVRTRTPSVQETQEADYYYAGGHYSTISETEKNILTAAGYGAYITPIV